MDLKEIKKILDLIADSEVNQVTIEEGDFKIKVKKTADVVQGSAPVQYQMPAAPQQGSSPSAGQQQPQQPAPSPENSDSISFIIFIASTIQSVCPSSTWSPTLTKSSSSGEGAR